MSRYQITGLIIFMMLLSGASFAQEKGATVKAAICDDLLRTGQLDAALHCYLKALEDNPVNPGVNLHVCQILESQGKVDQLEPYLSRLDRSSQEAGAFIEMLATNYKTLQVICEGEAPCRRYFQGSLNISFVPPEDLEPAKAARLAAIEKWLRNGQIWFYPSQKGKFVSSVDLFPVITGTPLPYIAQAKGGERKFAFNFIECAGLNLSISDLDSIRCGVPDTLAQLQVEIDDPGYEAFLRSTTGSKLLNVDQDNYYFSRGENSEIIFQKKGTPVINKKYLIITSLVLTSALILFER